MPGAKGTTAYRGELGPGDVVYRVLLPSQIDPATDKPVARVFLRRGPGRDGHPRDTDGLSLVLPNGLTLPELAARLSDRLYCYAFARLEVSDILAISLRPLRAVQDGDYHVTLEGLPAYDEYRDDETEALRLDDLRSQLSVIDPWRNPAKRNRG